MKSRVELRKGLEVKRTFWNANNILNSDPVFGYVNVFAVI